MKWKQIECADVAYIPIREKIFGGLQYDRASKKIYHPCSSRPIGEVNLGKIKWYKKPENRII